MIISGKRLWPLGQKLETRSAGKIGSAPQWTGFDRFRSAASYSRRSYIFLGDVNVSMSFNG